MSDEDQGAQAAASEEGKPADGNAAAAEAKQEPGGLLEGETGRSSDEAAAGPSDPEGQPAEPGSTEVSHEETSHEETHVHQAPGVDEPVTPGPEEHEVVAPEHGAETQNDSIPATGDAHTST